MTKRSLLVVFVAAALLIIIGMGALAHGGRSDGALANWFHRIHGH